MNVEFDPGRATAPIPGFGVEDVTAGAHAHGFGSTGDGRNFAFRVRGKVLHVDIYRADSADVPDAVDVEATADADVTDVDLADERSVVAAVRDAVTGALAGPSDSGALRSLLGRLGQAIDPT